MSSPDAPSMKQQARVAALQWGLVQAFLLDTFARLLRNYYRATTEAFFPPDWVISIQFAAPLALVVGGIGGYRWVTNRNAATSASAHRNRVVFVGSLVAGWTLAIVPTMAFQSILGERLYTVPFFVLPSLTALSVFVGSYVLAYRVDTEWYRQNRGRLLGAVAGAVAGFFLGMAGFVAYGEYLVATRTSFSLDGGTGIAVVTCLGAVGGYVLTGRGSTGDRAVEFLVIFLPSVLALTLLMGLSSVALAIIGVSALGFNSSLTTLFVPIVLSLGLASYLAYGAKTAVYQRFVGG
ncbi:hypothetical protein [Haloferax elongans]|nr:hypothetical protein [Haloferax elongans]